MTDQTNHVKTLKQKDIVLFTVSAILLLDTLAAAASVGAASIFWWLFLGVTFFIPFALISAEMGCSYPDQGGIYSWIKRGFSGRWASRATWCYWVNTAIWIPAIYILFAGVFKQLFFPELSLGWQIVIGVILTWVSVAVNVATLDIGKWVPNLGAILKVIVFVAVIFGAYQFVQLEGMANPITWQTIKPDLGSGLQYIPAIIYGMLGFELVSSGSDEMENPARDVPKAIFKSGLIIITLYLLGTMAVLAAIPAGEINLVEGLVDTLSLFFGGTVIGDAFVLALGIAALFTFFSNGVTWSLGCNRSAAEAANEGELPAIFGVKSKAFGTPIGASVLMGIVSTVTLALYGFLAGSNEDLFWSLFSFSAVIFLLPYQGMLLSFMKLRRIDANHPRPFKIGNSPSVANTLAFACMIVLALSIVLFIYTPGEGIQIPVIIGIFTMLVFGEIIIRYAEKQQKS